MYYTNQENAAAKKVAYNYIYSIHNLILGKRFAFDGRTRIGKLSKKFVDDMQISQQQKNEIRAKIKARKANKSYEFTNYLNNKLYLDYSRNFPTFINENFIRFNNRNHWAKTSQDFKVLAIIRKNFIERMKKTA